MIKSYKVWINGKEFRVDVEETGGSDMPIQDAAPPVSVGSTPVSVPPAPAKPQIQPTPTPAQQQSQPSADSSPKFREITAPMSGLVVDVLATPGMRTKPGTKLLVLEAMKMENDIICDTEGLVQEVLTRKGDNVETGQTLVKISKA